ncbi:choice-of-anchor L domain-containing protein, partial [Flavobacterium sp.]|uniref:choice-of-anchor L domain-containing protein n=1 Tax=Flavobacterium sp. TaxID=239 RepID=UPI0037C0798B
MKKITISIFLLLFSGILFSQSINVNTIQYTVPQLVQDVLINSPCAQVSNITWRSGNAVGTTKGIGYFSNSNPAFPMSTGVVMVSGLASSVTGPNTSIISGGNWSGDNQLFNYIDTFDLDPLTPGQQALDPNLSDYNDATIIEFDFLPFTNNMSFNFLFASEEYGTYQCSFSDAFAFFLTNTVTNTTTNLALIPGTSTPIAVTTIRNALHNSLCASANSQYFGVFNEGANAATSATNLNGQTVKLTASSTVIANNLYHIKLVIADRNDNALDSAVFIEGGSFNVGVANITYPIGLGGAYTQDMLVANGQAICPGQTRVISTGLNPNNFDFVWTRDGVNLYIDAPSITVSSPGTYCVSAGVPGGGACSQTDCIVVEYFTGFPINQTPPNLVVCSSPVNLTTQNSLILAGLDPTSHDVEYYFTMADAQAENNPITAPITIALGASIPIVARVTNILAACPEYATFNVTYINNNTVAAAASTPILCTNTAITPITHTTTGATGIASTTTNYGLPTGVTAAWASNTITISGTPTTTVGSPFNYTIPLTGGCGTFSATGTITVTQANTVTLPTSTPTLCINTPLAAAITHTTTGATGIGTPTGLP